MISLPAAIFALLVLLGGSMGLPLGLPPGPEDPVMSKIAPDDCVFYASWSGVAEIDPKANPTEKWMGQPTVLNALTKIRKAYRGMQLARGQTNDDPLVRQATRIASDLVVLASTEPAAFYLNEFTIEKDKLKLKGAVVISLGNRVDQFGKQFKDFLASASQGDKDSDIASILEVVELNGKQAIKIEIPSVDFPVFAAVWGKYFVVGLGEGSFAKLSADWKTPQPIWLAEMRQRLNIERVASLGYLDAPKITKQVFASQNFTDFFVTKPLMDLSEEFKSVGWVSGLDSNGYLNRTDIQIFKNKTGITSMFEGDPIPKRFLEDFPANPMAGFASRISTQAILEFINSTAKDAGQKEALEDSLQELQKLTGVKLEVELLDAVGDFIYLYYNFEMANPSGGWLVSVRIQDEMSFPSIFEQLNKGLKSWVDRQQSGLKFEVEKFGQYEIYSVSNQDLIGNNFAWSLIDEQWYFARSPEAIVKHVNGQPKENQLLNHSAIKEMFEFGDREGFGNPVAITSLNFPPIIKLIHPFVLAGQPNGQGNNRLHSDLDFDWADIPSLDELINDVQPNYSAVYRTDTGYQIFQRQTYPGASPPVSFFAIAAIALAHEIADFKNSRSHISQKRIAEAGPSPDLHATFPLRCKH